MKQVRVVCSAVLAAALAAVFALPAGCSNALWLNLTKERTGNVTLVFINNTRYRAIYTYGAYDNLDRSPGPVEVDIGTLGPLTTSAAITLTCARNVCVGTEDFIARVLQVEADTDNDLDPNIIDIVVRFSDAPAGSEAANLPTVGTAKGVDKLLGWHFSCGDRLFFTFEEDPGTEGGFRIDFDAILDEDKDDPPGA